MFIWKNFNYVMLIYIYTNISKKFKKIFMLQKKFSISNLKTVIKICNLFKL